MLHYRLVACLAAVTRSLISLRHIREKSTQANPGSSGQLCSSGTFLVSLQGLGRLPGLPWAWSIFHLSLPSLRTDVRPTVWMMGPSLDTEKMLVSILSLMGGVENKKVSRNFAARPIQMVQPRSLRNYGDDNRNANPWVFHRLSCPYA